MSDPRPQSHQADPVTGGGTRSMNTNSVLIVEDEAIVALDLKLQLEDLGYDIVGMAASGEQALDLL